LDSDGWFHTGDIGYFDEEEFAYIVDRKKDILKYQGFHVSPSEIESIINEMDLVIDSCVVGVLTEEGNDLIFAFVQRKNLNLSEGDVLNYVHGEKLKFRKMDDTFIIHSLIFRSRH
jgi:4-coumarate--CoA ligase